MPTTLTSLLLLVLLLLPGIAYVSIRERNTPEQRRSAFRETATVVVAGVVANAVAVGILAIVGIVFRRIAPNIDWLIRDPAGYVQQHYSRIAIWAATGVLVAVGLAMTGALVAARRTPHRSVMSGWWVLFEHWQEGRDVTVSCVLDDATIISGWFGSFNPATEETQDRDLILKRPITFAHSLTDPAQPYPVDAVCISARRIVSTAVTYFPAGSFEAATSPAAAAEVEAPPESGSPASPGRQSDVARD